ncbi:HAD hydrolase-like protein [Gleimia sp. 6138-11-ORH1]|uniref:HAD-IIA family hydrolase n=1 Tax=Gleimia sp. 6138-11-ORH1 TaxID=2973937 RepID=UPI00216A0517|nr:HAD hydrolase-like protein [Gleimia sp. 6138-11-ORH1]MCS4484567.1 HAD hydrolase-like protein [Gleimia sp. 6138-11-ORH1]
MAENSFSRGFRGDNSDGRRDDRGFDRRGERNFEGRGQRRDDRGFDRRDNRRDDRGFDRRGERNFEGRGHRRDDRGFGRRDDRGFQGRGDRNFEGRGQRRDDRGFDRRDNRRDDRGFGRRDDRGFQGRGDRNFEGRGQRRDDRGFDRRDNRRDDRGFGRRDDRGFGRRDDRGFQGRGDRNFEGRGQRRDDRGFDRRDDRGFQGRGDKKFDSRSDRRFTTENSTREERQGYAAEHSRHLNEQFDAEFAEVNNNIDGLFIPAGVEATELDKHVLAGLATLGERSQEEVAKLLVMAGQLIDIDPELGYKYAQAAVKRAGRVDAVREAAALTAYATERYQEALREVRAVRRMRGDFSLRAVEADCERALGKPEKALELIEDTPMDQVSLEEQIELVIVAAGARADLEEHETALVLVENALDKIGSKADESVIARLLHAKVEHLRSLGRNLEADELELTIPEADDAEIIDFLELADADIDDVRSDLKGSEEAPASRYDTLILDLDGVCYTGAAPIEHAAEGVNQALETGIIQVYVTNNSSRTPQAVAEHLSSLGFPVDEHNVYTSAMDAIAIMEEQLEPGSKVFVIGGEGLRNAVKDAGYELVESADDQPVAVVQGFDRSVDWAMLSEGALAINAGAKHFATNMDGSLPIERGFALGNGALVRAVRYCTGVKPEVAGKPLVGIYQRAIQLVNGERALAVGDRLETDIAGALNAGVPVMHVLTGVHSAKDIVLADRGLRPQLLHLDMRGLNEPHPRPRHHRDGTWTCGLSQVAKVIAGKLTLDGVALEEATTVTLDSYRALVAAAWEQAAKGPKVFCPELTVVENDDPAGIVEAPEVTEIVEETEEVNPAETLTEEQTIAQEIEAEINASAEFDFDESQISDEVVEFLPGEEDLEALLAETVHLEDEEN